MVPIVQSTGGDAVAVSDDNIIRWQRILAEKEGVFGEPTSSAAFAGLELLIQNGSIGSGDTVLVPVTGFGLKDAPIL
jgi:threonine synthase